MEEHSRVIEYMERIVNGETEVHDADQHHHLFLERLHAASLATNVSDAPAAGRLQSLKRRVLSMVRPATDRQSDFNNQMIGVLGAAGTHTSRLHARLDALEESSTETWSAIHNSHSEAIVNSMRATLASHDVVLEELSRNQVTLIEDLVEARSILEALGTDSDQLDANVANLRSALAKSERSVNQLHGELSQARARLDLMLRTVRDNSSAPISRTLSDVAAVRESEFYAGFEERFRGSRSAVLETFRDYDNDLAKLGSKGTILDVGSGRAEWLEHLRDRDVDAYGVDTNPVFVQSATDLGLDVRHEDAIAHLTDLGPESLGGVTAFHIAEHLNVEQLLNLLEAAFVAIKPGGSLLVETPNPTNLVVGAAAFYLDPTHIRPLHPDFLSFAVEWAGFVEIDVRYLRPVSDESLIEPSGDPATDDLLTRVNWSLHGPQDLAVLATRPGAPAGPS